MRCFWWVIAVLTMNQLAAQDNLSTQIAKAEFKAKQVVGPSPEAAELGKYGNVPVSLFTGTPGISVPLCDLKGKFLSLPVSLSFNASGFKPGDLAGWMGNGWSLNAGGVITRAVMGNPDNTSNYFGHNEAVNPPSNTNLFPYFTYLQNVTTETLESQPDVYYYNFAGRSGKFFLTTGQTVVKKDQDMLRIIPCIACDPSSFRIIDEQGVNYYFTEIESTRMVPNDDIGGSAVQYNFPSSWYLSRIETPGGESIEFEYYTTGEQYLGQNLIPNKAVTYTYGQRNSGAGCSLTTISNTESNTSIPPFTYIKKKFLKKITLKRNSVVFAYIDLESTAGIRQDSDFSEDRLLQQLKVYDVLNGTARPAKQFNFTFGYFENPSNSVNNRKRLRLESVQEVAVNGSAVSKPPYTFTYNTQTSIPERFTARLDHWGYFNAYPNTSLVPTVYAKSTFPSEMAVGDNANREASLEGSVCTMLTRLQYPTGGYSLFEYELNQAKFEDGTIHAVGGVRVKKITDYSFESKKATVKLYTYQLEDGTTSGVAWRMPEYKNETVQSFTGTPGTQCPYAYTLTKTTVTANSVFTLGSVSGSPVGYKRVVEQMLDETTSQALGYKEYTYLMGTFMENDDDLQAGKLLKESTYDNAGKLIDETQNTYAHTFQYAIYSYVAKPQPSQSDRSIYCRTSAGNYYNYPVWQTPDPTCVETRTYNTIFYAKQFPLRSQKILLTSQTKKIFDQLSNTYVIHTQDMTYGSSNHDYPTLIKQSASNTSELVVTANKYPGEYSNPSGILTDPATSNVMDMLTNNILSSPVESVQYRMNADGSDKRVVSGSITDYRIAVPLNIHYLETAAPLADITLSSISASGVFVKDSHYRLAGSFLYDGDYNLVTQSKANDIPHSYIWDYAKEHPVAEVLNAAGTEIAYAGFEGDGKGNFTYSGAAVIDGTAAMGSYSYSLPAGSIQASGLTAAKVYYVSYWSKAGACTVSGTQEVVQGKTLSSGWTLFRHKITGVSNVTITGSGSIDEVRLHPADAQMYTYAYLPLTGMLAKADANNMITKYEYDGLGRLINVRDDNNSIVKNYLYNYAAGTAVTPSAASLFYNQPMQAEYERSTGCPTGTHPQKVTFVVPYGKFASAVNQSDVDAKAQSYMAVNGQNAANQLPCVYWSAGINAPFFKNDCAPEQGTGSRVVYRLFEGAYKAATQSEADALAQNDVNTKGQTYANTYGTCSCSAEGKKIVNGVCETGNKIWVSTAYSNGQYTCRYRYVFSNGTVSQDYYTYSSTPCPQNP